MGLAIDEAKKSPRAVRPNPKVGAAILFKDGTTLSAHHKYFGGPHAEREVLNLARAQNRSTDGATIAVTLEPCSHFGKTPPCADALVEARVARVLVGSTDPFPEVNGRGLKRLREKGIEVVENVLQAECEEVNSEWLQAQRQGYPFVRVKMATSLDGLWAAESGDSRWITNEEARSKGHSFRARADAIVTGVGTVARDDAELTARDQSGKLMTEQPKVFVLSRGPFSLEGKKLKVHPRGAEVCDGRSLSSFFKELLKKGVTDVLVEAGPTLTHAVLESGYYNEILLFTGPRLLGGQGLRMEAFKGGKLPGLELKLKSSESFLSGDILSIYARIPSPDPHPKSIS